MPQKPAAGDVVRYMDDHGYARRATVTTGVDSLSGEIERWDGTVSLSYRKSHKLVHVRAVPHMGRGEQTRHRWFWA